MSPVYWQDSQGEIFQDGRRISSRVCCKTHGIPHCEVCGLHAGRNVFYKIIDWVLILGIGMAIGGIIALWIVAP